MKLTMRHIYQLDLNAVPRSGDWVAVKGNPLAPRGHRIMRSIEALGVQHLDMYYAYNEKVSFPIHVEDIYWNGESKAYRREAVEDACHEAGINSMLQLTSVQIVAPGPNEIRFFNGEVARFNDPELINDMMAEGYLEPVPFAQSNPILDDAIRDLVDAYLVDGLSLSRAQEECLKRGFIKQGDLRLPNHFYRPIGAYRERFVE